MNRRLAAEFLGTFWLVFGGCGTAVIASGFPQIGVGLLGVSFAFGLTVLTMAYAFGHISGGHFNPAVTLGAWLCRRVESRAVLPYIVTQVVASVAAASLLLLIANGRPGYSRSVDGLAVNGYGEHSPDGYSLLSCLIAEVVLTLFFLLVILGATDRRAPKGLGPLAIGLALTLIHLISIPITNTSVNPARSTGPALLVGESWAVGQLWLFWLAPLLGAAIAGIAYRYVTGEDGVEPIAEEAQLPAQNRPAIGEAQAVVKPE
jgi:aquaporin Z